MCHKHIYSLIVLLLMTLSTPIRAEHNGIENHNHDTEQQRDKPVDPFGVSVNPDEVVIIVHGIVCSFCSQGVTRNLSRLSFVDKSKFTKGVKVEIENQKVTIALKPGSDLELAKVFKSILKGGYEPIEAFVRGAGGEISRYRPEDI